MVPRFPLSVATMAAIGIGVELSSLRFREITPPRGRFLLVFRSFLGIILCKAVFRLKFSVSRSPDFDSSGSGKICSVVSLLFTSIFMTNTCSTDSGSSRLYLKLIESSLYKIRPKFPKVSWQNPIGVVSCVFRILRVSGQRIRRSVSDAQYSLSRSS